MRIAPRSVVLLLIGTATLLCSGCGNVAMQTRYIPTSDELTFDEDCEQLPKMPPALGDEHRTRPTRLPDNPDLPRQNVGDYAFPVDQFARGGTDREALERAAARR